MLAPVVVVPKEGGDQRLEVCGQLVRDLVYVSFQRLVIKLPFAVGLSVKGRRQDVPLKARDTSPGPLSLSKLVQWVTGT